jgi:DNA-binding LacI/PurR family transcriptional regulator
VINKKLTIIDIARLSAVSITTVSRVINHQPVAERTRQRVLGVIKFYEYYPDRFAQYLGHRSHIRFAKKRNRLHKV